MAEFFDTAFTMPTTIWSVLLLLVGLYWLVSLFGLFDFEMLDGALDATEALDGLSGAADGLLDGAHGVLDGADGMLDGADGALDGAHGVLDGADGLDHHLEAHTGFFHHAGFGEMPRIISLSLIVVFGWTFSYFGTDWVGEAGRYTLSHLGVVLGIGVGSLVLAIGATAIAIQPLRRVVKFHGGPTRRELIGKTCIVKTTRVDADFGQAETKDGQLLQVRAKNGDGLGYGTQCVIFDYDTQEEVFYISRLDEELS